MIELITIIGLFLVCIGQGIERYFYAKDMTNKLNDSIKAIMSRNINDYLAATAKPSNSKQDAQDEQIDFSSDNPDEFDKAIKNIVK